MEAGRLVGVEPWPGHPTGGALCAKGRAAPELQYHPQRLTRPLRRSNPKSDADPGWVEVSWDEALSDIAARLLAIRADSGAEAVAFSAASPGATAISDSLEWIERLIFAFGSPNFLTGVEICNWQRDHNHAFTFGSGIGMPDYANTDLVMLWGFSPGNVWLAQAGALAAARARGAKLLVIDPAPTRHAQGADRWLQVRPGTDAALALGIARELISSGLYDEAFVRAWTNAPFLIREDNGQPLTERDIDPTSAQDRPLAWHTQRECIVAIDTSRAMDADMASAFALRGRRSVVALHGPVDCRTAMDHYAEACEPWTPERAEAMTGISAAEVRSAARMIAAARRISYFSWTGISQHAGATQADRAIALLYALTGCVDAPGGNLHLRRLPALSANDRSLMSPTQHSRALGIDTRPLGPPAHGWALGADFQRAVIEGEPYRVRALVGFGANLLMSQPDTQGMRAALQALEFQVHCDMFETPTARHADYLLPVNTPWEREGLRIGFEISARAQQTVQLRRPVVSMAPGNEARSDLEIVFALATRLGLGNVFFGGDIEAGCDHLLAPLGLTLAALRDMPQGIYLPMEQPARQYAQPLSPGDLTGPIKGFATPSRRIEIYSPQFAAAGIAPVPVAEDPRAAFSRADAMSHEQAEEFPLTLCCAKSGYYCQSQHRAVASLRGKEPEPEARLHPVLAASRGIEPGDWFEVSTKNGRARFRAALDAKQLPDVVLVTFGWWQACEDLGLPATDPLAEGHSNMNALVTNEVTDPTSGSAPLRSSPCQVAALPGPRGWAGWKAFDARAVSRPAEGVIEIELTPQDDTELPDFRPGQFVRVAIDVAGSGRRERSYSLIGSATVATGEVRSGYRIAVKRSGALGMSDAMHDLLNGLLIDHARIASAPRALRAQSISVDVQRPAGRFLLPLVHVRPVVLMAAGIGITPFLSMLETMASRVDRDRRQMRQRILLLYGSRNLSEHAFADRIAALARRLPGLEVVDLYSQPLASDVHARNGRVDAASVPAWCIAEDARFYLCGPTAMLQGTIRDLQARGVARHAIFSETFESPLTFAADDGAGSRPVTVTFGKSGTRALWLASDGNLLAMAERLGLNPPGGCRVGQCESCRMTVKNGVVRHGIETDIAEEGACLACVAVPATDLEVDA